VQAQRGTDVDESLAANVHPPEGSSGETFS
jgi:hypothetical protein